MKKFFTLVAFALLAACAYADDEMTSYPFYTAVDDTTYAITTVTQDDINAAFPESWIYSSTWEGVVYYYGVYLPADFVVLDNDYLNVRAAVDGSTIMTTGNKFSDMQALFSTYNAYLNLGTTLSQSNWNKNSAGDGDSITIFIEDYSSMGASNHGFYVVTPKVSGQLGFGVFAGDNNRSIGIYKLATEDEIDNDITGEWVNWENFQHDSETKSQPHYVYGNIEPGHEYLILGGGNKNLTMHHFTFNPSGSTGINSAINAANGRIVVGYYTVNGVQNSSLQKGVNIVKYSDGSAVKVVK